jgi:hypothetical protein
MTAKGVRATKRSKTGLKSMPSLPSCCRIFILYLLL